MKIIVNEDDVKKFDESEVGKRKNMYLKRSTIIGIILIMFSICYIVLNVYFSAHFYDYILATIVLIFGIYFIINSKIIKKKEVNKYINELKKSKKR